MMAGRSNRSLDLPNRRGVETESTPPRGLRRLEVGGRHDRIPEDREWPRHTQSYDTPSGLVNQVRVIWSIAPVDRGF